MSSTSGNWGAPSWTGLASQYKVPTNQAQLYQGVAKAAVDPTATPASPQPTSIARIAVPGATSSQMGEASNAISTNSTTQPAAPASGSLSQALTSQPMVRSAAMAMPVASPLAAAGHGVVTSPTASVSYSGPKVVATPSANGMYNYYQFDASTGSYTYLGQYNPVTKKGGVAGYTTSTGNVSYDQANGIPSNYTGFYNYAPDAGTLSGATYLGALAAGPNDRNGADAVNNYYLSATDKYHDALAQAQAQHATDAANALTASALSWMENHNGQVPATGYTPDALAAAQTQYAAEMAGGQSIPGTAGMAPIDTSAVQASNQNILNAQRSANYNQFGGSDAAYASRLAGFQGQALEAQGANQLQKAAAASFNTNLKAFTDAVTAQASVDTSATGAKLNNDIMQIGDYLNTISQQAQQLGTQGQQQVNDSVSALQTQLNHYQQAVAEHGVNSTQAIQIAGMIIHGASNLSAAAV